MRRLLLAVMAVVSMMLSAQTFDVSKYKNTDVSSLSDAQIQKLAAEMSKRGYTVEQVEVMAKAQGASDKQIRDLKKRLQNQKFTTSMTSDKSSAVDMSVLGFESGDGMDGAGAVVSKKGEVMANGRDSLVFGFSLFNNKNMTFEPNLNIPTPDGYILGPGDAIVIDVWGQSQMSYELSVSNNGNIDIPLAGPVHVGGMTIGAARQSILARLKHIYGDLGTSTSASIRTGELRTITVNVMGEVFLPGTYTVSGASSLFNILYLSGGPTSNGSFRNVQLIRGGKVVVTLDVYDFILNCKSDVNVPLYNNDIIMIPTYQKRIAIGGGFKRNGYFEAKEGETVEDMIRYAGGFAPMAMTDHVSIIRMGKVGRVHKDVEDPSNMPVMNGDSIYVPKVSAVRYDNVVSIRGGVFAPGDYEYADGMKLSELLKRAGGLVENAFMTRGVITRYKDDYTLESVSFNVSDLTGGRYDIVLRDNDEVLISTIDNMREALSVDIKGAVREPGKFCYREGLTVGDLVLLAGGLTFDASTTNVEVVRKLPSDVADTSIYRVAEEKFINITRDLNLEDGGNSFVLMPYDVVTIREHSSANFKGTVKVSGEVRFAGLYEMTSKNDNIMTMIERAGGLTNAAYVQGARLYRRIEMTDKEKIIKRQQAKVQSEDTTRIAELMYEKTYELVSIDLESIMKDPGKYADLKMQDGDEIVVPSKLQTVRVSGQVLNPISLTSAGKHVRRYISNAGGFSSRAKKSNTFVVFPDGHAEATRHFLFIKNYPNVQPGCEIVVPEKPKRDKTSVSEVVGITSSLVTVAAVIISLLK